MIDRWIARLREPRFGVVFLSAVVALLMALHWVPMAVPAVVVIGLAVLRPRVVVRPVVWWVMAGLWLAAVVLVRHRMEDHVYLFVVWMTALAVSLAREDDDTFVEHVAWQARVLVGVTFTAAVAWKVYFTEFLTGMTLWVRLLVDGRFRPLATVVGLSDGEVQRDRQALAELLAGATASVEAPGGVMWRLAGVALVTLVLEAVVAVSHLARDSNRLAALRLPSLVLFAVVTYAVVPVVYFAGLLAVLAMATARWRRDVMWIFPVLVLVSMTRIVLII